MTTRMLDRISISKIHTGIYSPRKTFQPEYIRELADSIRLEGQLKPVLVNYIAAEGKYVLIDGEHRLRALQLLNEPLVRAEVISVKDEDAEVLAFRMNDLHGKKLEPIEEAMYIKTLMQKHVYTQTDIGRKLRKSQQWISQRLQLVEKLDSTVSEKLTTRVVNPRQARELLSLEKPVQRQVAEKIEKEKLSSRQTCLVVASIKSNPDKKDTILSSPVARFGEIVKTPEHLRRIVSQAPEEAVAESLLCPHCGKPVWVDWIGRTLSRRQELEE